MKLLLSSIYKTIIGGPGIIAHKNFGLIRYYVEEGLANKIDAEIENLFKINLREPQQTKTAEIHFLIYYRNVIFYYERFLLSAWNIFCAHYKHNSQLTEFYQFSRLLSLISHCAIFLFLCVAGIFKWVKYYFLRITLFPSKPMLTQSGKEVRNIAVKHYHGIDPQKRNDLFLLRNRVNDKTENCFIITENQKDFARVKSDIARLEGSIQKAFTTKVSLIPYFHSERTFRGTILSIYNSIILLKKFELSVLKHPLIFLILIIFELKKNSLANFFNQYNIELISNTNFNYESSVVSAAAFSTNTKSIFKEVSVWGDWSSVYFNKVLCNNWIASTKQSAKYIKKTQHFIDQITVSVPRSVPKKNKPILTQKKEGLEVLVIGSNASKNDNLFVPQHISIDIYRQKLYSYFLWASKREHVQITIKEKKADSYFFNKRCATCVRTKHSPRNF